jgi:hypothetical protein
MLIALGVWAVGALMITIFYKIALSVREGAETWAEERAASTV